MKKNKYYEEFFNILEEENREKALKYAIGLLDEKKLGVLELYEKILTPALNNVVCKVSDQNICIWKEHVKTGIVRTIVESAYVYVLKEREKEDMGLAISLCPPNETHDLAARMVSDVFTIRGYESVFVGSDTPYKELVEAIEKLSPKFVAISVSNFYNLFSLEKVIKELREKCPKLKILVGGSAFLRNQEALKDLEIDYYVKGLRELKDLPLLEGVK